MRKILTAIIVYLAGSVLILSSGITPVKLAVVLLLFIVLCVGAYCKDKRNSALILLAYMAIVAAVPEGIYGLPVIGYHMSDCVCQVMENKKRHDLIFVAATGVILFVCMAKFLIQTENIKGMMLHITVCILFTAAASVLKLYDYKYERLYEEFVRTKDNDREYNMALKAKNQYLIEKQDAQIYSATLKERNRIAREIHDNVGHLLSRSLLQMGAVFAVNKDENLKPMLLGVKETLNSAMSSIRSSVHDLHDESVDLKQNIEEILSKMQDYAIHFEYDVQEELPRELKYCIIAIVKEATSNIIKHSNADTVDVVLREHPAFYQLMIHDNGRSAAKSDGMGIGLENMQQRVEAFAGRLEISREAGFKIFIHIPKRAANV